MKRAPQWPRWWVIEFTAHSRFDEPFPPTAYFETEIAVLCFVHDLKNDPSFAGLDITWRHGTSSREDVALFDADLRERAA